MKKLFALLAVALLSAACMPMPPQAPTLGEVQLPIAGEEAVWNSTNYKGKPVLIVYMGSWCPYCKMSIPAVNAVAKAFEGKAEVVSAFMDEDAKLIQQVAKENNLQVKALYNAGEAAQRMQVSGLPSAMLFDKKHRLVKTWEGFKPTLAEEFTEYMGHLAD